MGMDEQDVVMFYDRLNDFFLDEQVGLNAGADGMESKAEVKEMRDKYFKPKSRAETDDEPIMIYDKAPPIKMQMVKILCGCLSPALMKFRE